MKKPKFDNKVPLEIASEAIQSQPENAFEQVNKYGTYEIQPTAEADQRFPEIAQGLPKKKQDRGHGKWGRE